MIDMMSRELLQWFSSSLLHFIDPIESMISFFHPAYPVYPCLNCLSSDLAFLFFIVGLFVVLWFSAA